MQFRVLLHFSRHGGIACNEVTHLREIVHDADACVDSRVAAQYRRRHRDALLREYSGHIAPPSVLFSEFRVHGRNL